MWASSGRMVGATLTCLLAMAGARAAEGVLEGDLGRWLDQTVAPELGETLSRHPRFQGETVRLVTLVPGTEPGRSNGLSRAVERRLRQRLLEIEGVRLALDRPRRACEPPQVIDYLVRIELTPVGGRSARVHVAVVDVAESVWVSGISYQWRGRLSSAERRALLQVQDQTRPGSAGSPIPLDDARAVAGAMKADLKCRLPGGLDGALYVVTPASPALARVGLALQSELSFEPVAALAAQRADARWLLSLEADDSTADVRELSLTLSEAAGGPGQRVAAVFVSGIPQPQPGVATESPGDGRPPPGAIPAPAAFAPQSAMGPAPQALLSSLVVHPASPEGICDDRKARVNSCAEIEFELVEPAYLFVLSTREHVLVESPCDRRLQRSAAGPRRFRLRLPPGAFAMDPASGPDAGFYVLATRDYATARRLREALSRGPGRCGSGGLPTLRWLAELQAVVDGHEVVWQAVHLVHGRDGITAL